MTLAEIEINDLASQGNIRDVPAYQLPPEAFSQAFNVRFYNGGVEVLGGRSQIFGTPNIAPRFALPVSDASQTYWLYWNLTKASVYDGAIHTDVTRLSGDYTAGNTRDLNGTLLAGIPILNNGSDVPQYWPSINISAPLEDLANWPSTHRAKVLRAFTPYLMAFNITDNGVNYPHRVLWSHPADPGSVPNSWDVTDPTVDAGQQDLADIDAGIIMDALPLGGRMFIYKESSIWRAAVTQSSEFIFDFKTFSETSGILAPRCVTVTGDGKYHVLASQDDIVIHNGTTMESLLTKKYKKYLFNQIDTLGYLGCFMFTNPWFNEVWFCYPESGTTTANRALIFNYREGGISEAAVDFRNVAGGVIETASPDLWSTASGTWATYTGPWSESNRRKLVACGSDGNFYQLDSGTTFAGVDITSTLIREGLGVVGRKRNGDWIVDFSKMKFLHRLWLKASGGPITVRVGFSDLPDGSITWAPAQVFDPATDKYVDWNETGRSLAIEITATSPYRLEGYTLVGGVTGAF